MKIQSKLVMFLFAFGIGIGSASVFAQDGDPWEACVQACQEDLNQCRSEAVTQADKIRCSRAAMQCRRHCIMIP